MTATFQLTGYEADVRHLMAQARKEIDSSAVMAIAKVFECMWHASLPFERVLVLANGLSGLEYEEANFKKQLSAMVRGGFLRSRVSQGKRLWEVNY